MKSLAIALAALLTLGANAAFAAPRVVEGPPVVAARSYDMDSAILKEKRRINVYLPAGYSDANRRFPVLYLLDGGASEDLLQIIGLVELAGLTDSTQQMIVVGIKETDRRRDFTAPSTVPGDLKAAPTSGGSAAFRAFIADELKPWVQQTYRTSGDDAIIGESLAGLFVTETFLKQPTLFDSYIAVSPSLWWGDQALAKQASASLKAQPPGERRLYLTIADEGEDMQEGMDHLVGALKTSAPGDLTWWYAPMPDEHHHTLYHPAALQALRLLYPGAKPK